MPDMSKIRLKETEYWFKDKAARDSIGDLNDLTTQNKESLISAINEVNCSSDGAAVLYTEQDLADEEQRQARDNIGVGATIADTLINLNLAVPVTEDDGDVLATADGTILVLGGDEPPFVKTVNGVKPDESGNVTVDIPETVTSWIDLADKPFYDVNKTETAQWDYSATNREYVTMEYADDPTAPFLVKISDAIIDMNCVTSGYHEVTFADGTTQKTTLDDCTVQSEGGLVAVMSIGGAVYLAPDGETTVDPLTLTGGIWAAGEGSGMRLESAVSETWVFNCDTVKQLDEKYIPNTVARSDEIPHADMSQNDSSHPDYVKNRTHWSESGSIDILKEITVEFGSYDGTPGTIINRRAILDAKRLNVLAGREDGIVSTYCDVTWNGQTYYSVYIANYRENDIQTSWTVGDYNLPSNPASASGEYPFYIQRYKNVETGRDDITIFAQGTEAAAVTLSIVGSGTAYTRLNERFIPDNIARKHDIITDWNELTNTPFEKEVTRITLTYDGVIDGRDYADVLTGSSFGYKFYKVSDEHLPDNIVVKGITHTQTNGTPSLLEYEPVYGDGVVSYTVLLDVRSTTFTLLDNSYTVPSEGIYFWGEAGVGNGYCSSFTYEVKNETLKPDYLPKAAAVADAVGETVTAAEFNALLAALRDIGYLSV